MTPKDLKYHYWIWKGAVPYHLREGITSFKKWREWAELEGEVSK